MKQRKCTDCSKLLSCRQALYTHRKYACKKIKNGFVSSDSFLHHTQPAAVIPNRLVNTDSSQDSTLQYSSPLQPLELNEARRDSDKGETLSDQKNDDSKDIEDAHFPLNCKCDGFNKDKTRIKSDKEMGGDSDDDDGSENLDYEDEIAAEKEARMDFEDKISKLVEYLSLHDVEEVGKILNTLEDIEIGEEEIKTLRKLVKDWIDYDRAGEEPNMAPIEEVLKKLSSSGANRSELLRLTMALKDIKRNYYRVSDILRRMKVIFDDENRKVENVADGIKGLIRDELISEEQYDELMRIINDLDMEQLIKVIRTTKSGRGIDFLPRDTKDLYQKVIEWTAVHQKDPSFDLKQKILSALHELRFRKAIKKNDYDCAILELDY